MPPSSEERTMPPPAPPIRINESDSDYGSDDGSGEWLHDSLVIDTIRDIVLTELEASRDASKAFAAVETFIADYLAAGRITKQQANQLEIFGRKVYGRLKGDLSSADINRVVKIAIKEAKEDQDFDDDLKDAEDDEALYKELAELRKRKNRLGSTDPAKLAMHQDKILGASGGGVFSLFHSKS